MSNYENLEYVLNRYEETNSILLEALVVYDTKSLTPIHIAVHSKSNRSINLLLKKLAKINLVNSRNLKNIFADLLDFVSFSDYLNLLFF